MADWEYATAIREPDGTLWDQWPHEGLTEGRVTLADVRELIAEDEDKRDIVILRRPVQADWAVVADSESP